MKLLNSITMTSVFTVFLCTSIIDQSQSFIFSSRYDVHPKLSELAKAQTGTLLSIGLSIQNPKSLSQLYIDGLQLELQCTTPSNVQQCIPLPGVNGDNPQFSTGPLHLNTKSEGTFISIHGTQKMNIQNEAWEMIWVADRPTGSIICGFQLPQPLIRNDAVLPSGKIYISFRVWTPKGLYSARNDKMAYDRTFEKHLGMQKNALEKMNLTGNPIMKAIHFRDAAAANEMVSIMHTNKFNFVPLEDENVVTVGDGLLVSKEGSIWTMIEEPALLGKKDRNVFIGRAFLKQ